MICRIDDCSKFTLDNLIQHFQDDNQIILARLYWSNSIWPKADITQEILLDASDSHYCVLVGVSTWLEYYIESYDPGHTYVFNNKWSDDPIITKGDYDAFLKGVLGGPTFRDIVVVERKKGAQSLRKFATTHTRQNGCNKYDTDPRAKC